MSSIRDIVKFITGPFFIARLRATIYSVFYRQSSSHACIFKGIYRTLRHIKWGRNVLIFKNCRIEGISRFGTKRYTPLIELSDGVTLQQNCHITCAERIAIGANTAIASNVTITDIEHGYTDIRTPIEWQDLIVKPIRIGSDCKIYNNAVILQGCEIGNHCVIGANSVVKGKFPDYSVIVGIPARVVKRYNPLSGQWEKTRPDGSFIDPDKNS